MTDRLALLASQTKPESLSVTLIYLSTQLISYRSVSWIFLSERKTNEGESFGSCDGNKKTCWTKTNLVETSQQKHNGHNNTKKNQFCLNIYLSNKPLNIPLICASGEKDLRRTKPRRPGGRLFIYLFIYFCIRRKAKHFSIEKLKNVDFLFGMKETY